jgi:hypothetical protein
LTAYPITSKYFRHQLFKCEGYIRFFGGSVSLAYAGQLLLTLCIIISLIITCRRKASTDLVNALTAIGALLATPYSLDYDMMMLGVSIAFAVRYAGMNGFAPYEKTVLALLWITPLIARSVMQYIGFPLGVSVMLFAYIFLLNKALSKNTAHAPRR